MVKNLPLFYVFWLCILAVLAIALIATPARPHDWYNGLTNRAGQDCCGGSHCKPIDDEHRIRETRDAFILDEKWVFPKSEVLPSRDGHFHACIFGNPPLPKCFLVPQNV
jgi:hypothetical protein